MLLAAMMVVAATVVGPALAADGDVTTQRQDRKACKMFLKDVLGFTKEEARLICKGEFEE